MVNIVKKAASEDARVRASGVKHSWNHWVWGVDTYLEEAEELGEDANVDYYVAMVPYELSDHLSFVRDYSDWETDAEELNFVEGPLDTWTGEVLWGKKTLGIAYHMYCFCLFVSCVKLSLQFRRIRKKIHHCFHAVCFLFAIQKSLGVFSIFVKTFLNMFTFFLPKSICQIAGRHPPRHGARGRGRPEPAPVRLGRERGVAPPGGAHHDAHDLRRDHLQRLPRRRDQSPAGVGLRHRGRVRGRRRGGVQ